MKTCNCGCDGQGGCEMKIAFAIGIIATIAAAFIYFKF